MKEGFNKIAADSWWLLCNAIGAAAYLWLSSQIWIEPELRGQDVARSGDAMLWATTALPVLVVSILANLVWFIRRAGQGRTRQTLMLVALLWTLVLCASRWLS